MNTLSRAVTAQFFTDPDAYCALRQHWSRLMNSDRKRDLSAAHQLLYLALCGKDWRQAFTPPTNPRKLANGAYYGWALHRALRVLHSSFDEAWLLAPFDGLVTASMLQAVRRFIPPLNMYRYRPEQFTSGIFPFDAYVIPESAPVEKDAPHA